MLANTHAGRLAVAGFRLRPISAAILCAGSFGAHAQGADAPTAPQATEQQTAAPATAATPSRADAPATLPAVRVIEFRGEQMDSSKYSRDLNETPRLISILPSDLLEEQNALSLKDALKNIPGVSLQAGEGNPPGGDQFKIRGFNGRDDINVNDTRDLGNYFRDPFYIDQLEVVKGPNSAFAGRGSAGGTVNFVTKKPHGKDESRVETSIGSDELFRATLDVNKPIGDNSAVRVNILGHDADIPGRDLADEQRYGLYGAYTWGLKGATKITADLLYQKQDDRTDAGLPPDRGNLLGQGGIIPRGLDDDNYYGHKNDERKVDVGQLGLAIQHAFANGVVIKNQTRLSQVENDGWTSSPRIFVGDIGTNTTDGVVTECTVDNPCVRGETKPRDQEDTGINNQTDVLISFATGAVKHDLVVGAEFAKYEYENDRRLDTRGPLTSLYNPRVRELGSFQVIGSGRYGRPTHDGTTYKLETDEIGVYLLDTMALTEKLDLNAGVRWDQVEATASRRGFDDVNGPVANNTTHDRDDDEVSYSLGLVYKLRPEASLYASFGNAYVMSANFDRNSVQLAGGNPVEPIVGAGFDTPPEEIKAYELGAKWTVAAGLDLGAAVFRTETTEGRFPGQDSANITTPNVEYFVEGIEILATGRITDRWRLYSGYTYLRSEIEDAPQTSAALNRDFVLGQELGGTPKHSFTLFTTYDVTAKVTLGGGLQYVDEVTSGVDPLPNAGNQTITVDDYTVVDFYGTYKFTPKTQIRLNLLNAFDEDYISQLAEGGGQAIPGRGRQAVVSLRHDF